MTATEVIRVTPAGLEWLMKHGGKTPAEALHNAAGLSLYISKRGPRKGYKPKKNAKK